MATAYQVVAVDNLAAPPLEISARLRSQLVYFMTPPDAPQVPQLQANDYWVDATQTAQWLAEGALEVVSPLDEERRTIVELSEEQETFLEWLAMHRVQHIRVQEA